MPRIQNPKIKPLIRVPEDDGMQKHLEKHPRSGLYNHYFSRKGEQIVESPYVMYFSETIRLSVRQADQMLTTMTLNMGSKRRPIHTGTLYTVMGLCSQSRTRPVINNGEIKTEIIEESLPNGEIVGVKYELHMLTRVGSRVEMTLKQIAEKTGIPLWRLREQIPLWKQTGIIFDHGKGALDERGRSRGNSGVWIEFDSMLCWRGNLRHRAAYTRQIFSKCGQESWIEIVSKSDATTFNQPTSEDDQHAL